MIEALRMLSVVVWLGIIILLFKPMLRAVWTGGATKLDKVLAATWWLSLNRICFVTVSQYTPDAPALLAFCYTFGIAGGIALLITARGALSE